MAKKFEEGIGVNNLLKNAGDTFQRPAANTIAEKQEQPSMVNLRQTMYGVKLSAVRPDPYQARHVLPLPLREPFYNGTVSWVETVNQWLQLASQQPWVALAIQELDYLSDSITKVGQIKPITGKIIREGEVSVFRLLTGERRFWATAIGAVKSGNIDPEPVITAIVDNNPSVAKQIQENTAYKPLTSAGKARATARLILEASQIFPDERESSYIYHRKALDVRISEEVNRQIQEVMGFDRQHFYHLKKYLELPEDLIEMCELSDLPERVLREIVTFDAAFWRPAIEWFSQNPEASSAAVVEYIKSCQADQKTHRAPRPTADPVTKLARGVFRTFSQLDELPQDNSVGAVASAMVADHKPEEIRQLVSQLNALGAAIQQRLDAKSH